MTKTRVVCWKGDEPERVDCARVLLRGDRLLADGSSACPAYQLRYRLETGPGWVTRRLTVDVEGEGWRRRLRLTRSEIGHWAATGSGSGNPDLGGAGLPRGLDLSDALDCDLGLCPLTNTMPIRRHRLVGATAVARTAAVTW